MNRQLSRKELREARSKELREAEICAHLPDMFGNHDDIPKDIIGSTITAFGTFVEKGRVEGGLVVEYRPENSDTIKRVVFGFNDIAMWVESEHPSV